MDKYSFGLRSLSDAIQWPPSSSASNTMLLANKWQNSIDSYTNCLNWNELSAAGRCLLLLHHPKTADQSNLSSWIVNNHYLLLLSILCLRLLLIRLQLCQHKWQWLSYRFECKIYLLKKGHFGFVFQYKHTFYKYLSTENVFSTRRCYCYCWSFAVVDDFSNLPVTLFA